MKKQNKTLIFFLIFAVYFVYLAGYCENVLYSLNGLETPEITLRTPNLTPTTGITKQYEEIYATVTGFNTVVEQCDSTPCLAAGGYICGRDDIVACPRSINLNTRVIINDKIYTCLDRTALKYDGRFDISFDKDIQGAKNFGIQKLKVSIIK